MPKGPVIPDYVKRLIAQVWLEHQDWVGKEVMTEVHGRLRKNNPYVKANWPKVGSVQNVMRDIRIRYENRPPELRGLDDPWHVISLAKYDLPGDALPSVLRLWLYRLQKIPDTEKQRPLTVREAQWTARLYRVIQTGIETLDMEVTYYAAQERAMELVDTGSRELDRSVEAVFSNEFKETIDDIDFHNHATNSTIWYKLVDKEGNDISIKDGGNIREGEIQVKQVVSNDLNRNKKEGEDKS